MLTSTRLTAHRRAFRAVAAARLVEPATVANTGRNAHAEVGRHARWAPAREAAWQLIAPLLSSTTRVAIIGAGNGDTLPLERIAAYAGRLALIDLDATATRTARRRQPRKLRSRIEVVEHDITGGVANSIVSAAAAARVPDRVCVPERPLPGSPYDLVIGDLFYSQLLYPALVDLKVPSRRVSAVVERYGPMLTRSVVARMHVSAPDRHVIHIHDPIAWWRGHPQPVAIDQILTVAERDPDAAIALAHTGTGPRHADPRDALREFRAPVRRTALWHWPFAHDVDYLVAATIVGPIAHLP